MATQRSYSWLVKLLVVLVEMYTVPRLLLFLFPLSIFPHTKFLRVLNRWTCHTLICPDSLRAYNNLTAAGTVFKAATAAAAVGFATSLAATNSPSWR